FKLSKQNHAQAIDTLHPQSSLNAALAFLGQQPVETQGSVAQMLAQAVDQFQLSTIPQQSEILIKP
ncbi:tRNA glutamyl-Q(34) synthetase GluQRS, partial [Shewanella baltica]|nr:tRNA glutamyl-Q(34) synthetase GluQRS [Shewanella baltica]